jgi:diguanylate cyclase (GGDEF)-like protein/PAS domain S-box-containing protein
MFGYSIGETRGMETALLYPDRASFERLGQEAYPQLWAGKTYTTEMEMLKKNGTRFWCNLTGRALNAAQPAEGSIWMSHDITERKQAEAELHRSKAALSAAHQELQKTYLLEKQLARTDTLTGINNRGYLFELAEREFNVAMRYQRSFSIIMFDVDYFKQVNDTFGHLMGDQVLQGVTQAVCAEIRSADLIGRYGGDEFIVLMPQTTAQESLPLAERIHASVATLRIATDKDPLTVMISIGIAQMDYTAVPEPGLADTVEGLFLRADKALYKAKHAGRNRTVIFD